MSFTFLLASTTAHGLIAADSLISAGYHCLGVLTPPPRLVGRQQQLTPTPTHLWAQTHNFPTFFIDQKISPSLQSQLPTVDFLLVIDFGYYIPSWLIDFPHILALNLHPSALPQYRGASPGQYVIANQEKKSAISIIALSQEMDAGDLITQLPFTVPSTWTTPIYYQHAFKLAAGRLPTILSDFASDKITTIPQKGTPTFAPKITKDQAFIPFNQLFSPHLASRHEALIRAYQPWPLVWTLVPTHSGEKRMQILSAHLEKKALILDQVKLEGETVKHYQDLKNKIINS